MPYDMVYIRDHRSSTVWFRNECVLFLCRDRGVSVVGKEVKNFIDLFSHSAKPATPPECEILHRVFMIQFCHNATNPPWQEPPRRAQVSS